MKSFLLHLCESENGRWSVNVADATRRAVPHPNTRRAYVSAEAAAAGGVEVLNALLLEDFESRKAPSPARR